MADSLKTIFNDWRDMFNGTPRTPPAPPPAPPTFVPTYLTNLGITRGGVQVTPFNPIEAADDVTAHKLALILADLGPIVSAQPLFPDSGGVHSDDLAILIFPNGWIENAGQLAAYWLVFDYATAERMVRAYLAPRLKPPTAAVDPGGNPPHGGA